MAITFKTTPASAVPPLKPKAKANRRVFNTQPQVPLISLDEPGLLRACHFQALLGNMSQGAFYQRRKKGVIPKPDGHDPRPFWRTETVRAFLRK